MPCHDMAVSLGELCLVTAAGEHLEVPVATRMTCPFSCNALWQLVLFPAVGMGCGLGRVVQH